MSKFKVTNPDEPIEIDLYQDIPSKDPDTGIDQVDSDGNILVKRYVTRSINSKGIANIKNALPQITTNKEAIAILDKYAKDNVASINSDIGSINDNILNTQNDLSDLTQTVSVIQGKINGIQGIDIDDVQADVEALKKSAYLITGGVLKGDVSIQTPKLAVLTLTPTGSSSYASFSCNNDVLDCTTTWGKIFKISEEGAFFYGLSDKATQDALGQNIADNYIKAITGANATLIITKGAGTTSTISINNVLQAQKAVADKNNKDITTTYATKTENTATLTSAKAYVDQEKAKYLPLHNKADTAGTADVAIKVNSSNLTSTYLQGNQGNVLVNSNAAAGSYTMLARLHSTSGWFTHGAYQDKYLMQYTSQNTVNAGSNQVDKSVTLLDEAGNSTFCGTVTAPTFVGTLRGNITGSSSTCTGNSATATTATKAVQDSAGQQINTTYIKNITVSGTTVTFTRGNGTTGSFNTQDTNTTYSNLNQFTNGPGYITGSHNFSGGVIVSGYTITVG